MRDQQHYAHFSGGPKDGQIEALKGYTQDYKVPSIPKTDFSGPSSAPMEMPDIEVLIYEPTVYTIKYDYCLREEQVHWMYKFQEQKPLQEAVEQADAQGEGRVATGMVIDEFDTVDLSFYESKCDCGGKAAKTTHSHWCSTNE